MYKNECMQYKKSYEQSKDYISCLEGQIDHLKVKIERLNKIAHRFHEKEEKTENTLSYANHGTKQALHQLHETAQAKHDKIYGKKNTSDVGTLTVLFNLKKNIQNVADMETKKAPMQHKLA